MSNSRIKAFSLVEISVVILIIGVLIAGIAKGSRVIKHFKEASRENSEAGIAAYMIGTEGLKLWLNASASNSFNGNEEAPSDGATVTQWQDIIQKYDSNHAPRVFSAQNTPTYVKSAFNGLPAVDFNGSNERLSDLSPLLNAGTSAYSFAVVWSPDVLSDGTYGIVISSGSDLTAKQLSLVKKYDSGHYGFSGWTNDSLTIVPHLARQVILTIGVVNGTKVFYYSNGTKYESSIPSPTDMGTTGTSIGGRVTANIQFFDGKVAEVMIFDKALTQDQVLVIQDYLLKKYGIDKSS